MRVYPLPTLADGRKPQITSGFHTRNPSRPTHNGVDLFYRWLPKDGPHKLGDGGATRDKDGNPKWFIPDGVMAIAAAEGVVQLSSSSPTGWRIWIAHGGGVRSGYFHLRNSLVVVGQAVVPGTALGIPGDNPKDIDAKHLHFEVSPSGHYAPMDPETWLQNAGYFTPP